MRADWLEAMEVSESKRERAMKSCVIAYCCWVTLWKAAIKDIEEMNMVNKSGPS